MAYGSNSFLIAPAGRYPRQRIRSAGNEIITPMNMERVYRNFGGARLPVTERNFTSGVERAKFRMRYGMSHNMRRLEKKPRHAEAITDSGLGFFGRAFRGRFSGLFRKLR